MKKLLSGLGQFLALVGVCSGFFYLIYAMRDRTQENKLAANERWKEEADRDIAEHLAKTRRLQEEGKRELAAIERFQETHPLVPVEQTPKTPPPTRASREWTPQTQMPTRRTRTLSEWTAIIQQDAKLSTIIGMLGRPDRIKSVEGRLMNVWGSQMDDGTKNGTALAVEVDKVRGEMVIMGIYEPANGVLIKFPWYGQLRD